MPVERDLATDSDVGSDRLRRHRTILEDLMDPDYGLLDQLLEIGALSRREVHEVKSERTFERRNTQIIEYVSANKCFEKLIRTLRNTNQKHIANYLTSDGGRRFIVFIGSIIIKLKNRIDYWGLPIIMTLIYNCLCRRATSFCLLQFPDYGKIIIKWLNTWLYNATEILHDLVVRRRWTHIFSNSVAPRQKQPHTTCWET